MKQQTFGENIAALRKELGMTQMEVAAKMGVTDKAVSKWERNLSLPDVALLPKLAELFHVTVDDLMQADSVSSGPFRRGGLQGILDLVCKAIALAMGVAVTVLTLLGELETSAAIAMLGIGLACLAISQLSGDKS